MGFFLGASNQCFYKPGAEANNPFSKIVGLLNTGAQIVTGAMLGGRKGEHFKASMFIVHISKYKYTCYSLILKSGPS